ncbi:MAG: ATP-binding protein [Culicoidibacterales bacterium]
MKLSRKIFLYSGILMAFFMISWFTYMFIMLPSLYRAQVLSERQNNVKEILLAHQTRETCQIERSDSAYESVFMPKTGSTVYLCGTYGKQSVAIKSDKLKESLGKLQQLDKIDDNMKQVFTEVKQDGIMKEIRDSLVLHNQYVDIGVESGFINTISEEQGEYDVKIIDKNIMILTATVKAKSSGYYANIIGVTITDKGMMMTLAPSIISDTASLIPTITQSIPMFLVLFILLLFISTLLFLRQLARPIEMIAKRADDLKHGNDTQPVQYKGNDAIKQLSNAVDEMYQEIHDNYQQMKLKNDALQKEKERQRAFLLATSHELKTPVATSRLLVNSMIEKVGKYKDTERYLPEVRDELIRMQHSVMNMLDAYETVTASEEEVSAYSVFTKVCKKYQYLFNEKDLEIVYEIDETIILHTSSKLLFTIFDNMISNAYRYADAHTEINVVISKHALTVFNRCKPIAEEVIQALGKGKIDSQNEEGHGLGIYLIYQYCRILGMEMNVQNIHGGVEQILHFNRIGDDNNVSS